MSYTKIIKENKALNWMSDQKQAELLSEIKADTAFPIFDATMQKIMAGNKPGITELLDASMEIALKSDLTIETDRAVYFSGVTQPQAENFVAQNPEFQLIHTRPAGAMLEMLSLFGDGNDLTAEEAYQPWYVLAARYAETAKGNITAFLDDPQPTKTFRSVELSILLANDNVTTINQMAKSDFSNLVSAPQTSLKDQFAKANKVFQKNPNYTKPAPSKFG